MSRRRTQRTLALLALAFTLFAALPCSALAGGESCCGPAARCGAASESPCAKLGATPCCESDGAPLEVSAPVTIQDAPSHCTTQIDVHRGPLPALTSAAPPVFCTGLDRRSVILRL